MNEDVFRAILSMDSYNRGYGAGVNIDLTATSIGNATILQDSSDRLGLARTTSSGFYASAYNWNDEVIISYRGTDLDPSGGGDFFDSPAFRDIWGGWTLGLGFASASQGHNPVILN